MDGVDGASRRRSLKERLGLKGMGCCAATWGFRATTVTDDDDDEIQREEVEVVYVVQSPPESNSVPGCMGTAPSGSGMNLAAALAAERQFRASHEQQGGTVGGPTGVNNDQSAGTVGIGTAPGTPFRMSLMRLLEETADGGDVEAIESGKGGTMGNDSMCCVCMMRKKGAAFIPCGHTFCRVCSRELWLNRGFCPLCNRSILEILDIF